MRRKKRPIEFSKKILMVVGAINVIVIVFTLVVVWRTFDLTPLNYLIPAIAAETATGTGFYYAKAKVENRIKLMKLYKVNPSSSDFTDKGGFYNG